jgi:parallel beta-helix repeat protein
MEQMGRRRVDLVSVVWVLVLLVTVFGVVLNVPVVRASGTIYIRADGSIEGTTSILTTDNVTYLFTANINDSIVVERNNIIIDGNGHTLEGVGSGTGIDLSERTNVTAHNATIKAFDYGIWLDGSSSNIILGNNITANNWGGIWLYSSSNNSIVGNNVATNNQTGIHLDSSSTNRISGNSVTNNSDGISLRYSSNNNSISGNNVTDNSGVGIGLSESSDNTIISGNNLGNNYIGIDVSSSNNTLSGNSVTNNSYDGIGLSGDNNSISGNNITDNTAVGFGGSGIDLEYSSYNSIVGNNIANNNYHGISLWSFSNYNSISGNDITENNECGIYLSSSDNSLTGNNITGSDYGLGLGDSSYNTIVGNNIANNEYGICFSIMGYSFNNTFYHNNFLANTHQVYSTLSTNIWDDGYPSGGNYWSDYGGNDSNHDGIGDTPYAMDANNIDHYPLMNQYVIPEFPIFLILPLFMITTLLAVIVHRKRGTKNRRTNSGDAI